MKEQRKKIWIDRFQTHLFVRIALYFIIYQAAVWALFAIERKNAEALKGMFGAGAAGLSFLFGTAIVLVLGVLFIYDALVVTHRVVGPIVRFRRAVQAITDNDELTLINLRQGDYLTELRDDFNEMLKALEQRGAITIKQPSQQPAQTS